MTGIKFNIQLCTTYRANMRLNLSTINFSANATTWFL